MTTKDVEEYFLNKFGVNIQNEFLFNEQKDELLLQLCSDSYSSALYNHDEIAEECFSYLLKKGANANSKDVNGQPILSNVCRYGTIPIVEQLLKTGIKVDQEDDEGKTALFHAVTTSRFHNAELLIKFGADVNKTDKSGLTVLFYAVTRGDILFIQTLLRAGADATVVDPKGETPLFYLIKAVSSNVFGIVKLLTKSECNINLKNKDGITALHLASQNEKKVLVSSLLKNGADLYVKDKNGLVAVDKCYNEEIHELFEQHEQRIRSQKIINDQKMIIELLKSIQEQTKK